MVFCWHANRKKSRGGKLCYSPSAVERNYSRWNRISQFRDNAKSTKHKQKRYRLYIYFSYFAPHLGSQRLDEKTNDGSWVLTLCAFTQFWTILARFSKSLSVKWSKTVSSSIKKIDPQSGGSAVFCRKSQIATRIPDQFEHYATFEQAKEVSILVHVVGSADISNKYFHMLKGF